MANMNILNKLNSPMILKGDDRTGYRDPALIFANGMFYLYYTYNVGTEGDVFQHVAMSKSNDLRNWSSPCILTPSDKSLNYSSPGNIIYFDGQWIMCLQTYPRPHGEKYGNQNSRVYLMRSHDLETWSEPELIKVRGNDVSFEEMGRMIDPYLLEDKDERGKWWCFYKQNGVSFSYSYDLKNWTFCGSCECGENVCVIVKDDNYLMFHSPANGIGMKISRDIRNWNDHGQTTALGQNDWAWASGRITAGFVLDMTANKDIGKYLLLFHGTPVKSGIRVYDTFASIGMAWSDDLINWEWHK